MRRDRAGWSLLLTLALLGCAASDDAARPRRAAPLLHLVGMSLVAPEPASVDALQHDCDLFLAHIPSVVEYASGRHLDTGRATVTDDYDVFVLIGFDDVDGYRAYLEHPDHLALVAKWKPLLSALVVRDVGT
ncbi:MAG: Dabb family protein [Planctomycetes bacterium]|nr:Dabb family protein [Planctomycetota bacterium]